MCLGGGGGKGSGGGCGSSSGSGSGDSGSGGRIAGVLSTASEEGREESEDVPLLSSSNSKSGACALEFLALSEV